MLESITLKAIQQLKKSLGDLAISCTLRKRAQKPYVPGQAVSYTEVDSIVKGVITKYRREEVDGTLIQVHDAQIILFPNEGQTSVIPQPNDVVIANSISYRVISNNPMWVGSEIAFNLVQGRPV